MRILVLTAMEEKNPEPHPFEPFLPSRATILILGSSPPPRARWAMEFYYPNLQNDMWRIFGLVFFGDKDYFMEPDMKRFSKERLIEFLGDKGIALCDTGRKVIRHKGNAADKYLEIVEKVDLAGLLEVLPECRVLVTTGEKATETLISITGASAPAVGGFTDFVFAERTLRHYRMPSSSRAYPKPLSQKAEDYTEMFRRENIL